MVQKQAQIDKKLSAEFLKEQKKIEKDVKKSQLQADSFDASLTKSGFQVLPEGIQSPKGSTATFNPYTGQRFFKPLKTPKEELSSRQKERNRISKVIAKENLDGRDLALKIKERISDVEETKGYFGGGTGELNPTQNIPLINKPLNQITDTDIPALIDILVELNEQNVTSSAGGGNLGVGIPPQQAQSDTVLIQAPDGTIRKIPRNLLPQAIANGGVEVG